MTSRTLFAWVYLPESEQPIVAGKHTVAVSPNGGKLGTFTYAKSYLSNKNAFAFDPVSLPLSDGEQRFTQLNGYPSVLLDTCPDQWGMRVIDRLYKKQHFPDGYLLMNDPGRVGALAFSADHKLQPVETVSRNFSLDELLIAANALEEDKPIDMEILLALMPGTGGARPKCTVHHKNSVWIAKFPSIKDTSISIPRLEHATMTLARLCGVDAAMTELTKVGNQDVCLVERFDRITRDGIHSRKHFLSARTIFSADPNYTYMGSYQRLAKWLPRFVAYPLQQLEQLYRRMVFNVAVRNSDDHELNHGLIHVANQDYMLSPAFDILPTLGATRIHQHALLIGDSAFGTKENLLGIASQFNLSPERAKEIINDIESKIKSNFLDVFYEAGFGDEDVREIERYFAPIPDTVDDVPPSGFGLRKR